MTKPAALVLRGPGTNCDRETLHAFEQAGADAIRMHVRQLAAAPESLERHAILCIPGGFSYGDDIASGRILAAELSARLREPLLRFRDRGGLILGICNGFQVLLQTGLLLPALERGGPPASLTANACGRFVDRWVRLRVAGGNVRCVFLEGLDRFELPVAHAEGRFTAADSATLDRLERSGHLVLRYAVEEGSRTGNPNGSAADVAGVCDASGRVLGLMPHPERSIIATQRTDWCGRLAPDGPGDGLAIFRNAVAAASG
jgi:phosphoribosylformylglycinamidine synthase I